MSGTRAAQYFAISFTRTITNRSVHSHFYGSLMMITGEGLSEGAGNTFQKDSGCRSAGNPERRTAEQSGVGTNKGHAGEFRAKSLANTLATALSRLYKLKCNYLNGHPAL